MPNLSVRKTLGMTLISDKVGVSLLVWRGLIGLPRYPCQALLSCGSTPQQPQGSPQRNFLPVASHALWVHTSRFPVELAVLPAFAICRYLLSFCRPVPNLLILSAYPLDLSVSSLFLPTGSLLDKSTALLCFETGCLKRPWTAHHWAYYHQRP